MSSQIQVTLAEVKMLAGIKGVDILVDGEKRQSIRFGETVSFEVDIGERAIQAVLHGVVVRKSKVLPIVATEGAQLEIDAKYSRLWGNIKLKLS